MNESPLASRNYYFNDVTTPLGQITSLGIIHRGTGTERGVLRVYGAWALVYFLEGTGEYCDANQVRHKIVPGDLVLVTPELPHRYSTRPGRYWSECHLIFDGPVFDLCRTQGILNSARPVTHLEPVDLWLARLQSVVTSPISQSVVEKTAEVGRLLALLVEIFVPTAETPTDRGVPAWLASAKATLGANLEIEIDPKSVARQSGVSYETFRRGFQREVGTPPGLYRTQKRIDVACRLLKLTTMTHRQIAEHLGFADEFYFSKRFKQITGIGPREYRRRREELQ